MRFLGGLQKQRWVVEGRKEKFLHRFPGPCPCWLLYFFGSLTDRGMSGGGIRVQHRIADQQSLCWVLLSTVPLRILNAHRRCSTLLPAQGSTPAQKRHTTKMCPLPPAGLTAHRPSCEEVFPSCSCADQQSPFHCPR